ncbi:MAG: serine hydroxymethyltransferase [Chloroflexota bacterium]
MQNEAELLRRYQMERVAAADPTSALLLGREELRQQEKLIFIPSESMAPRAVMALLGSVYTNLYAEGYPSPRMLWEDEEALADYLLQEVRHRRFADRRYYKGTDYANLVESLARRRIAHLFAATSDPELAIVPDEIHANVQALSGAAANNAVYEACLRPGDTILGMDLTHGGHLTHGSPYNRSGRYYKVASYGVSPETGRLDYDQIEHLAQESRPRLIVAGASAYPWDIDWRRLRAIADGVPGRALLLADIAHPAGLVVAGLFPNPIGYADVVTFTTHKTLVGPRGAVILTTEEDLGRKIDRAVFPGEQGGPHMNNIAAMAVAFKMAEGQAFRTLQRLILDNAKALADGLQERGLRLAYGGTNTHLLLVDLNAIKTPTGVPLKGDVAARLLDNVGIVCNKNTIPGDLNAAHSSAIRLGTVWASQRGLTPLHMDGIAAIIHDLLTAVHTFSYVGSTGPLWRGKVELSLLGEASRRVQEIVAELPLPLGCGESAPPPAPVHPTEGTRWLRVRGPRAQAFLQDACAGNVLGLATGERLRTAVLDADGQPIAEVIVVRPGASEPADHYLVATDAADAARLSQWLLALSEGYTIFDRDDLQAKVQGPVVVEFLGSYTEARATNGRQMADAVANGGLPEVVPAKSLPRGAELLAQDRVAVDIAKPYFVGRGTLPRPEMEVKPRFEFQPYEGQLRPSALYEEHLKLTAARNLVPFAGWNMPVWYTGIAEEHRAVRETAGLFDVTHMGVLDVSGPGATRFLDLLTTNYVPSLRTGQAQYAYVLDPAGAVLDDILIYCLASDRYMLVVNAANAEKVKAWFDAAKAGQVAIDYDDPRRALDATATVRDLKDAAAGTDQRVDISMQGPRSLEILLEVIGDESARRAVRRLRRSEFIQTRLDGIETLVSRTGYTGEDYGYELYVHPEQAPGLWRLLLEKGKRYGLRPTGLGARDSARAEAGFPLYGHELAGPHDVSPAGAGYGSFVKLHKPYFVGRGAYLAQEQKRQMEVVRFALGARGVRMTKGGDPVVNKRGEVIGYVTSAVAVDGQQIGLAYVDRRYSTEDTPLGIFSRPREGDRTGEPAKADLKPGDRVQLHEEARIISRFPRRAAKPDSQAGEKASYTKMRGLA